MERKLILLLACLACLFGLVRISTVAGYIADNKEILEAWWEVDRGLKKPEQVYECIKEIQKLYAALNISELSYDDKEAKVTYDILFNAWNPTPDQCNENDFTKSDYFDRYFLVKKNIGEYWRHCERKRIQVCEPVLEQRLQAEVDRIGEVTTANRVKLLVDSVADECAYYEKGAWYELDSSKEQDQVLTAGALKYLETLEGPLSKSVFKFMGNSRDRFTGVYKRLVVDLCAAVFDAGAKQIPVFKVIKKYNRSWKPTGLIEQWMEAEEICNSLIRESFVKMTYERLLLSAGDPIALKLLRKKSPANRRRGPT